MSSHSQHFVDYAQNTKHSGAVFGQKARGWLNLLWLLAAAFLGFTIAFVFADILAWPRRLFLVPHLLFSSAFAYAYLRWSDINLWTLFRHHWRWGLLAAILAGTFQVMSVRAQPQSGTSTGLLLAFDLLWLGVIYGTVDALLLSVLPVLVTWQAFITTGWTTHWSGRIAVGVIALLASLFVTAIYHLGYSEYHGSAVVGPLIGNGMSSLAYLLSDNPLGAIVSHVAMHVAAVLQGPETTIQLPPHY